MCLRCVEFLGLFFQTTEGTTNFVSKGSRQNITLINKAEDFLFVVEITRNPDRIENVFTRKHRNLYVLFIFPYFVEIIYKQPRTILQKVIDERCSVCFVLCMLIKNKLDTCIVLQN